RADLHLGDGELACRNVGKQVEDLLQWVFAVVLGRKQHDLGIDLLEGKLELLVVADADDGLEAELLGLGVQVAEAGAVPCPLDPQETGVGACPRRVVAEVQDGEGRRVAQSIQIAGDDDAFGATVLGTAGVVDAVDGDEKRDAVALGDGLAEAAALVHGAGTGRAAADAIGARDGIRDEAEVGTKPAESREGLRGTLPTGGGWIFNPHPGWGSGGVIVVWSLWCGRRGALVLGRRASLGLGAQTSKELIGLSTASRTAANNVCVISSCSRLTAGFSEEKSFHHP